MLRDVCRNAHPTIRPTTSPPSHPFSVGRRRGWCVALDDILGVLDQTNIPGTVEQHPNWRRKLPVALEDIDGNEGLRRVRGLSHKAACR